jgi:hypothetical protein
VRFIVLVAVLGLTLPSLGAAQSARSAAPITPKECDGVIAGAARGSLKHDDFLDAACKGVRECTTSCAKNDVRSRLVSRFDGSFSCPGKAETIVSLAPCKGGPGEISLVRGTNEGWRRAASVQGVLMSDACKVEQGAGRSIVLCKSVWESGQGSSSSTALCAAFVAQGELRFTCPLHFVKSAKNSMASKIKIGDVQVLPGATPKTAAVSVMIGRKSILFDLDERGLRLSAEGKAILDEHPLPGLEIQGD